MTSIKIRLDKISSIYKVKNINYRKIDKIRKKSRVIIMAKITNGLEHEFDNF